MSSSAKHSVMEPALAKSARFTAGRMYVLLDDGREISIPLDRFPRLRQASPAQRRKWQISAFGTGILWPDIDEDIGVATEEAFDLTRRLAKAGIFVGISSGANLAAALHVAQRTADALIVVVFCDGGEKYLSERFWDETRSDGQDAGGRQ